MKDRLTVVSTAIAIALGVISLGGSVLRFVRWVAGLHPPAWGWPSLAVVGLLTVVFAMFRAVFLGDWIPRRVVESLADRLDIAEMQAKVMEEHLDVLQRQREQLQSQLQAYLVHRGHDVSSSDGD